MQNISFNDGYKEYSLQGDPNKVIRINPSDYGMIERFSKARKTIIDTVSQLEKDIKLNPNGEAVDELDEAAVLVAKVNGLIYDQIDYIFNAEVSKMAFGRQSPISTVGGEFLFEKFLNAVNPILQKEIQTEQKASQKRIQKYTGQVK